MSSGATKKMDWNNGLRPGRQSLRQQRGIHRVSAFVDINEDRLRAAISNRFSSRHERVRHGDYLVFRPNVQGQEAQPERLGPTADADGMRAIAVGREICFESRNVRTSGKSTFINNLLDRLAELPPKGCVVGFKV